MFLYTSCFCSRTESAQTSIRKLNDTFWPIRFKNPRAALRHKHGPHNDSSNKGSKWLPSVSDRLLQLLTWQPHLATQETRKPFHYKSVGLGWSLSLRLASWVKVSKNSVLTHMCAHTETRHRARWDKSGLRSQLLHKQWAEWTHFSTIIWRRERNQATGVWNTARCYPACFSPAPIRKSNMLTWLWSKSYQKMYTIIYYNYFLQFYTQSERILHHTTRVSN